MLLDAKRSVASSRVQPVHVVVQKGDCLLLGGGGGLLRVLYFVLPCSNIICCGAMQRTWAGSSVDRNSGACRVVVMMLTRHCKTFCQEVLYAWQVETIQQERIVKQSCAIPCAIPIHPTSTMMPSPCTGSSMVARLNRGWMASMSSSTRTCGYSAW